jgi:hypothetical protein
MGGAEVVVGCRLGHLVRVDGQTVLDGSVEDPPQRDICEAWIVFEGAADVGVDPCEPHLTEVALLWVTEVGAELAASFVDCDGVPAGVDVGER